PGAHQDAAKDATVPMPTVEELERIQNQARDEGYRVGYQEGQAAARREAERLGQAAGKLEQALAELEQATAEELLQLALALARLVVRREISAQPEAILDVVRDALGQLPHQHAAIFLNPEDAALVRSHLGENLAHAGHRVHEDPKLARGDCVLEAGGSQVDGTVAMRWKRVLDSLNLESAWQEEDEP
ncbi:MAG TPA: FliH/SctL family protein, partial [Rhodocyclaceae bacterium]|nr:FliH/SctL family protein [Rhodocyclaceae bacterium]